MAESEKELKSLLMKVKEESEKTGLKLNIQKMKIMASGPITSWEIDGETVETVSDFYFWRALKLLQMVIAAMKLRDAYSLEVMKLEVMTNLDSILKSRDITLSTTQSLLKLMSIESVMPSNHLILHCPLLLIDSLPSSRCLLISWLQSPSAVILEPPKINSDTVSPSISHEVMGPDVIIFVF